MSDSRLNLRPRDIDVVWEAGGAVGDVTTSTANDAIAAAGAGGRLYWQNGTYDVPGLVMNVHGQVWEGQSQYGTILQTDGADLVTFSGASTLQSPTFENMTFRAVSGGGHLFTNSSGLVRATWRHVTADQQNDAKSVFSNGDKNYIRCLWDSFNALMPATSSVPGFDLVVSSTRVNGNTWSNGEIGGGGTHFFLIECDHASTYNYDNAFTDIVAETCNGGIARILTGFNTLFRNVCLYDATATTADTFVIDKGSGGLISKYTLFERMGRRGGTLGGGLYDIHIASAGAQNTVIDSVHDATLAGYKINLGTTAQVELRNIPSTITVDNVAAGTIRTADSLGTIRTGRGATGSRPSSPEQGDQWYDTTLGKPIWYTGAAWHDAAGNAV